jgi:hypothetical protein
MSKTITQRESHDAAAMILDVFRDDTRNIDFATKVARRSAAMLPSSSRVPTFEIMTKAGHKPVPADTKMPHL